MRRTALPVLAVALLPLTCTEPYPGIGGTWQYASTLTYPSDFDIAPGQSYVCTYKANLTIAQSASVFDGTYDSLTIACNSGAVSSGFTGTVIDGALSKSGPVSFAFDSPSWLSVGTLHGDSMGGSASDSVNGLGGMETATGTWSACKGRPCR